MVRNSLRALWDEPAPDVRPCGDWALLGVVVVVSVVEVVLREDRAWLTVRSSSVS